MWHNNSSLMLTWFTLPRSVVSKLVSWTGLHTSTVDTRCIEWCRTVWTNRKQLFNNRNSNLYHYWFFSHIKNDYIINPLSTCLFVCLYLFVVYCMCWREQGLYHGKNVQPACIKSWVLYNFSLRLLILATKTTDKWQWMYFIAVSS